MFMRGQIGPCPEWMAALDLTKEVAAIEEKWIKTGKMISLSLSFEDLFGAEVFASNPRRFHTQCFGTEAGLPAPSC